MEDPNTLIPGHSYIVVYEFERPKSLPVWMTVAFLPCSEAGQWERDVQFFPPVSGQSFREVVSHSLAQYEYRHRSSQSPKSV